LRLINKIGVINLLYKIKSFAVGPFLCKIVSVAVKRCYHRYVNS